MPIVAGRTKKLSPLDEDLVRDQQSEMANVLVTNCKEGSTVHASDRRMFVEIGTTILTARSCDMTTAGKLSSAEGESREHSRPVSLQECEIFQPIQPQSLAVMKTEMGRLWDQGVPVVVEIKGQSFPHNSEVDPPVSLLLEQWTLQVVPKRSQCAHSPVQFLHQAVTSFLHFSQIRSWMVASKGSLPFQLVFRVSAPGEDEEQFTAYQPDRHCFPLVVVQEHYTLMIVVRCLPRLQHIPPVLVGRKKRTTSDQQQPIKSLRVPESSLFREATATRRVFSSIAHPSVDDLSKRTAALCITSSHTLPSSESLSDSSNGAVVAAVSTKTSSPEQLPTFPFSPPQPSPLSPKLLSGLADVLPYSGFQEAIKQEESTRPLKTNSEIDCPHSRTFCFDTGCVSHQPVCPKCPSQEVPKSKLSQGRGSGCPQRSASCSYPLAPSGVCPPSASSPIPFARKVADEKRRSLAINIKRPIRPPVRSNSAPSVVPSLYLLGTFEESVLNGRLEPCGYVDGFTAELGASGSFCPRHVTLPVTASFFSLAEHGGTSPYLGQIDLSEAGKRGYRIPKKGTVQVTLLNPNKTVVKIYFVKYDFSDMPPNTQTFLRQKTLSRSYLGSPVPAIPALHYLIHLRFLCSKSGHLYLHRNIRLIFARRAPDTDPDLSKVSLYCTTDGPTDPKYGPVHSH